LAWSGFEELGPGVLLIILETAQMNLPIQ